MATREDLKRNDVRHNLLRIYENFYWIHLWIIEVCARWITKRTDVEGKLALVQQAWDERAQMEAFKKEILQLGFEWDTLRHDSYLFTSMKNRYGLFQTTEDELEVLIGMNLFSEAVFGVSELQQLYERSPAIFPHFPEFLREEIQHGEQGRRVLTSILEEKAELRPHANSLIEKYRKALLDTTSDPEFAAFLQELIRQDLLGCEVLDRAMARFKEVFDPLIG